ncbi:hypothetical protein [Nocardia sp. NPDC051570]|uniref:hypothetical protein n=1 Tax=Nocardia sp. NPDC051570 TaxID=3364324 RepID=UPI0037B91448
MSIMTDHPGWLTTAAGDPYRAFTPPGGTAAIVTTSRTIHGDFIVDLAGAGVRVDWVDPAVLAGPDDLLGPLKAAGVVARVANPSLWDAMATAIMRQVVQAGHARTRFLRFCAAYGTPSHRNGATARAFPDPHRILALSDEDFQTVGAAFPRAALRNAARAYLAHCDQWEALTASELVTALQTVDRIGPWTARAAVADYTNDFSLYDYSDMAVQAWAQRLNPDREWPQGAPAFKAAWEETAGNQLSAWTLLTLAWGISDGKELDRSTAS